MNNRPAKDPTSNSWQMFWICLQLMFIWLKLTGQITWSWVWVLAPIWVVFVANIFLVFLLGIILGQGDKK